MSKIDKKLDISFRLLTKEDIPIIAQAFNSIKWNKPHSLFEQYLEEQAQEERIIWLAFIKDSFAGYITLKRTSLYQPFYAQNIPEIMDLNVLPASRNNGIGSMLLDIAEDEAKKKGDLIGIGVGLYGGVSDGYGAAQRLYIARGYIPDGNGVTYDGLPVIWGERYLVDDDLILWLTKKL